MPDGIPTFSYQIGVSAHQFGIRVKRFDVVTGSWILGFFSPYQVYELLCRASISIKDEGLLIFRESVAEAVPKKQTVVTSSDVDESEPKSEIKEEDEKVEASQSQDQGHDSQS